VAKKASLTREFMRATMVSRRRKTESEQDYLNRIVLEVSGLSDDVRANLSPEAKARYRAAVEAISQGAMIPSLTAHLDTSEGTDSPREDVKSENVSDPS
jgi:hypothetical protein